MLTPCLSYSVNAALTVLCGWPTEADVSAYLSGHLSSFRLNRSFAWLEMLNIITYILIIFFIFAPQMLFLEALTLIHNLFHPSIFCSDLYLRAKRHWKHIRDQSQWFSMATQSLNFSLFYFVCSSMCLPLCETHEVIFMVIGFMVSQASQSSLKGFSGS